MGLPLRVAVALEDMVTLLVGVVALTMLQMPLIVGEADTLNNPLAVAVGVADPVAVTVTVPVDESVVLVLFWACAASPRMDNTMSDSFCIF